MNKSYPDPFFSSFQSCLAKIWFDCLPNVNAIDGFPAVSYTELNHPSLDLGFGQKWNAFVLSQKAYGILGLTAALLPTGK